MQSNVRVVVCVCVLAWMSVSSLLAQDINVTTPVVARQDVNAGGTLTVSPPNGSINVAGDEAIDVNGTNVTLNLNGNVTGGDDGIEITGAFNTTINIGAGVTLTGNDDGIENTDGASGATTTITNNGTIIGTGSEAIISDKATFTLTNNGTIRSNGAEALQFESGSGGTITNNSGASIISTANDGIQIDSGANLFTINNSGTIQAAADNEGVKVQSENGVTLNNLSGGVIQSGTTNGNARGVEFDADFGAGTNYNLTNAGSIIGQREGVKIEDSNTATMANVNVTNTGTITGTGFTGSSAHGLESNFGITVTNSGTIQGGNGSGINVDGLTFTTTVTNNAGGIIRGTGLTGDAVADGDGVDVDGRLLLTNHGTIIGTGAGGTNKAEGIAAGGGTITNTGTITGGNNGILIDDSNGAASPFATSLNNTGTIQGQNGFGITFIGAQNDTITNSGTISGSNGVALNLGDGDDTLNINGGTLTGNSIGGAGSDTVNFNGSFNYTQNFQQFETGNVNNGATVLLNGGANEIAAVNVNSGGIFGGSGSTTGTVQVNNGGTLAPGNSIGTQTVIGDVNFNAGSIFAVEVQGNPSPGSDLLAVTGTTTINSGATISVTSLGGVITNGQTFTILSSNGGINGSFGNLTESFLFLNFTATRSGNNLVLTAARQSYTTVGMTANQDAVAAALDNTVSLATGDLRTVIAQLDTFTNQQNFRKALDALNPEALYALREAAFLETDAQFNALDKHLRQSWNTVFSEFNLAEAGSGAQAEPMHASISSAKAAQPCGRKYRWNVWRETFAISHQQDDEINAFGVLRTEYEAGTYGGMLGFDYLFLDSLIAGLYGSLAHTDLKMDRFGTEGETDSISLGMYTSYNSGGWYADGTVMGGVNWFEARRGIVFANQARNADSDFEGWHLAAKLAGGYRFNFAKHWRGGPTMGVQFQHLNLESYTETGAGGLNLRFPEQDTQSLRTLVGGRVEGLYEINGGKFALAPHAMLVWLHEFLDDEQDIVSGFAQAGSPTFTVRNEGAGREAAQLTAGLRAYVGKKRRASMHLHYDGEYGPSGYSAHGGNLGFNYKF